MHTLLIVEDEKLIRQGIKVMVQRSGVPVDNILECSNGETALEILKMQKVDVMFTDIRMPKMDGTALVKAMQKLPHMPLTVAVSGYDDFAYAVEMLRTGVRDYILKPVDRNKVKEILAILNREIEAGRETARKDRDIGCQQLKYYILNRNMPETEKQLLIRQYGTGILSGEYRVVCANNTGYEEEPEARQPYVFLKEVEGHELYISDNSFVSVLLREELNNRYVGISGIHTGIESLNGAWEEALAARKEAFFLNRPAVCHEEVQGKKEPVLHLEETAVKQIVQLLGTDKYKEGIRQLSRIFRNAALGSYSPAELEQGIQVLMNGVLTTYAGVISPGPEEIRDYCRIYGYPCLEEFEAEVTGWLTSFCDTLNSRFDDHKNKQKVRQAIAYIRENYDKDLNMAVVSNHISMNYSLFSYVFKQYTGSNFVNYLKGIRIEEAKRLLEESDMKVVDISARVGYENEKHFMKTFKAACGVSPTEYRKNMQYKGLSAHDGKRPL